ncbi:N-formylglutamate amidohydrolase [Mesonia maritima]|uniref:N-formylglutamate amidohydrolase n=1 Tax=Mesonia maritima TaxID=1793873 RepID=A0ABU1K974_9FLAO|nr:N-formylglutamate amidohydrolase [Mesonia maritima]MDR6301138.1 putative N-formylglutamate amidohydrolase [Mesonia maritima]
MKLVLTSEHGGNLIPQKYRYLFKNESATLNSHKGFDKGTFDLFTYLSPIAAFSKATQTSRLLIEANRSLHHPALFSVYTNELEHSIKNEIIEKYYAPYRNVVEEKIAEFIAEGETVFHLSVHSFTPILNGEKRTADIGILYDSKRLEEKKLAQLFKKELNASFQHELKIQFNYPYLGSADGFTTYLRKKFPKNYIGIELEMNQKFVEKKAFPSSLKKVVKIAVEKIMEVHAQELK